VQSLRGGRPFPRPAKWLGSTSDGICDTNFHASDALHASLEVIIVSVESHDLDKNSTAASNKGPKLIFRVFLFTTLAADVIYYFWTINAFPHALDSYAGLIWAIPIFHRYGPDENAYVNEQTFFIFWGLISFTIVMAVFGIVKGLIDDPFLKKKSG
jgi:hypothetical protein